MISEVTLERLKYKPKIKCILGLKFHIFLATAHIMNDRLTN